MKVYWGGISTGKNFLKQYCSHNEMSIVSLHQYYSQRNISKVHSSFLDKRLGELDNRMWCDWTETHVTHFKTNNIPRQISYSHRRVEYMKMMNLEASTKRVWNKTNYIMDEMFDDNNTRKMLFSPEQVSIILQSEYTDSLIISHAVKNYKNILHDDLIDEVLPKDIPKCDIVIPSRYMKNNKRIMKTKYIPLEFNEYDVIVPYKSNIKHHVETVLDFMGGFTSRGNDIVKVYNEDKKWLWNYLDEHCIYLHIHGVEQALRENNIKYRYFDMDNDSYPDFFGGKMIIDRQCTDPFPFLIKMAKDKQLARKKYDTVQEIADEYITTRNLTDVRLP